MSTKSILLEYYSVIEGDYAPEEIANVKEILQNADDELSNLSSLDITLLLRLIDDSPENEELYNTLKLIQEIRSDKTRKNLFDED